MRLISLTIERMPGFPQRGVFYPEGTFQAGINLIIGRNGSGKTTTCLAVRKLLWPYHPSVRGLAPVALFSQWELSEKRFAIDIEGSFLRTFSEASLPPEQNANCYTILMDDLFEATDSEFANTLSMIAYGGYDLESVRKAFQIPARSCLREKKELMEKQRKLDAAVRKHRELQEEEDSLNALSESLLEAKRAVEQLERVELAIGLLKKREELAQLASALSRLPPGAAHVREEDLGDFQLILLEEKRLAEFALPPEEEEVGQLERKVRQLEQLERTLKDLKTRARVLETDYKQRYSILGSTSADVAPMDLSKVRELQQLWMRWHGKVCDLQEWDARLKTFDDQPTPGHTPEEYREGVRLLSSYVQAEEQKWLRLLLWCTPLLTVLLYKHPFICMVSALFATCVLFLLKSSSARAFKRSFLRLGLPKPSSWAPDELRSHMQWLETKWGEAVRYFRDKETAQIISVNKNICKEEAEELYKGLEEAGFSSSQLSWVPFLHELTRSQDLFFEVKKQEVLVSEKEESYSALLQELEVSSADEAETLLARCRRSLACHRELRALEIRKRAILARCCLSEGGEGLLDRIKACSEQREEWINLMEKKAILEERIREEELLLGDHGEFKELAYDLLVRMQKELQKKALDRDFLLQQEAAIRQKIAIASSEGVFEERCAQYQMAELHYDRAQKEFAKKVLGNFLIERMENLYEHAHQPEVLKRATHWFSRFTHGAVQLQFFHGRGFSAYETKGRVSKPLDALSRGTRIQLILAVRLAFMEAVEGEGSKLPLFLDEAMSHADDERFYHIAEALAEVAESGRQVFYFTCQQSCVQSWQRVITDPLKLNLIDLDALKETRECRVLPFEKLMTADVLPLPSGKNLVDYARELNAPGIDFSMPPSHWHVGHFVDSAEGLYQLVLQGITYYGQWKALAERGLIVSSKILERGRLAEQFYALASIGRGRRVSAEDLQQGGVSDRFLEEVYTCAKLYGCDPRKLIAALKNREVPGFREKGREELEEYLVKEGCLDPRDPLELDEVKARLWLHARDAAPTLSSEERAQFINMLCRGLSALMSVGEPKNQAGSQEADRDHEIVDISLEKGNACRNAAE